MRTAKRKPDTEEAAMTKQDPEEVPVKKQKLVIKVHHQRKN
jgi:hypothetical protein